MMSSRFGVCLPEPLGGGEAIPAMQGTARHPWDRLTVSVAVRGDVVGKGLLWSVERLGLRAKTPALSRRLLGHQLVFHHPLLSNQIRFRKLVLSLMQSLYLYPRAYTQGCQAGLIRQAAEIKSFPPWPLAHCYVKSEKLGQSSSCFKKSSSFFLFCPHREMTPGHNILCARKCQNSKVLENKWLRVVLMRDVNAQWGS